MGPVFTITDPDDPRLDDYRNLTDAELRRQHAVFIAEGALVVRQLLRSRYPVRSVLVTPAKLEELGGDLGTATVYVASTDALEAITGFHFHRGALAAAERVPAPDAMAVVGQGASRVAVLEGVNDHENLGALFRNAAAFWVDAVLLSPSCADPLYRRSVRVSMGHVLRVPWATLSPWPSGLEQLRAAGFRLVALTPDPEAEALSSVAVTQPTALLLGSEGHGLSPAALHSADVRARIPIAPAVDSLNVATAAAIAFHALGGG